MAREPRAELPANHCELLFLDITKEDDEVVSVRFGFCSFGHFRDVTSLEGHVFYADFFLVVQVDGWNLFLRCLLSTGFSWSHLLH